MTLRPVRYIAPEPTPEQIANAAGRWDPYDLIGISKWWALSPSHPLVAAAVIHDELYLHRLDRNARTVVDRNFNRDCFILASYHESILDEMEAHIFTAIVIAASRFIDTSVNRNTETTQAQGDEIMGKAKRWVNFCAKELGMTPPYQEYVVSPTVYGLTHTEPRGREEFEYDEPAS